MMAARGGSPLAIPRLAPTIPHAYRIPGNSGLSAPLALALLESDQVPNQMFALGPNALLTKVFADVHERDLASRALTNWWARAHRRYPSENFMWTLSVADRISYDEEPDRHPNRAWFILGRSEKPDTPRFSLAHAIENLELRLEGFGQTVLAVLFDCTTHLPQSLTPWRAYNWAEMLHWSESEDDREMIALAKKNGDAPEDLMTRACFFENMPRWVVCPERKLSREEIVRAARDEKDHKVIAACDAIHALVSGADFVVSPDECGTETSGEESYEAFAVISWRAFDAPGNVIDEWLNMIGQSGEAIDAIDIRRVELTTEAIEHWMRRTEQMMHLAKLTDNLLCLIGEPF